MQQTTDPYANERAKTLIDFVNSVFSFAHDENRTGLYIERTDGHRTRVDIIPLNEKVIIKMDDVEMGYFEEMSQRGYKCSFRQQQRPHIKDGLYPNEALMRSICDHPLILFHDA